MQRGKNTIIAAAETLKMKGQNGQISFENSILTDTAYYINFDANGVGGIFNLVDSKTKRIVGITNIDGQMFLAGKDVIIDSLCLKAGFGPTIDTADYSENFGIDPRLKNAEIRFRHGKNILSNLPITQIIANENCIEKFARNLTAPILLQSNKEFEIQIELPKNQNISNLPNIFFRLEMTATDARK